MSAFLNCQTCGSVIIEHDTLGSVCPACALMTAFNEEEPNDVSTSILPREFGPFILIEEIGRGGMGIVYRARQRSLERDVALKVIVSGAFSGKEQRTRFQAEATAVSQLRHPGIVSIYDFGTYDDCAYYAMELVEGGNLSQLQNGKPLPALRAAELTRSIALAVEHAHSQGIIHRDLKPANILLADHSRPMVTDFGLAKRLDEADNSEITQTGQMLGSPAYTAPENAGFQKSPPSVLSDVYGLGGILYHLITGRPPFSDATPAETLQAVILTSPVSPRTLVPSLPSDLETICLKCLRKEPANRYSSAQELVDDLDRFLNHQPIRAKPPSLWYRSSKFARRYWVVVSAIASVILALSIGLFLALKAERFAGKQRELAEYSQRQADHARQQAESTLEFMLRDLRPALSRYGRISDMRRTAEEFVSYFESLPIDLRSDITDRAHASSLEALADIVGIPVDCEYFPIPTDQPLAQRSADQALQLRKSLAERQPEDPDAQVALLNAVWLDAINRHHHDVEERYRIQKELIKSYRELVERFPENVSVKLGLARALNKQTFQILLPYRNPEETLNYVQEAHALFKRFLQREPNDPRLRADLLRSFRGIAICYYWMGQYQKSYDVNSNGIKMAEALLAEEPNNVVFICLAATQYTSHRRISAEAVDIEKALEFERKARVLAKSLAKSDPENPSWSFMVAFTSEFEMSYLLDKGRFQECLEMVDYLNQNHSGLRNYAYPSMHATRWDLLGMVASMNLDDYDRFLKYQESSLGSFERTRERFGNLAILEKDTYRRQLHYLNTMIVGEARFGKWERSLEYSIEGLKLYEAFRLKYNNDTPIGNHFAGFLMHGRTEALHKLKRHDEAFDNDRKTDLWLEQNPEFYKPISLALLESLRSETRGEAFFDLGKDEQGFEELKKSNDLVKRFEEENPDSWNAKAEYAISCWKFANCIENSELNASEKYKELLSSAQQTLDRLAKRYTLTPPLARLQIEIETRLKNFGL